MIAAVAVAIASALCLTASSAQQMLSPRCRFRPPLDVDCAPCSGERTAAVSCRCGRLVPAKALLAGQGTLNQDCQTAREQSAVWMYKMASDALDPHQNSDSPLASGSQFTSAQPPSSSASVNMSDNTADSSISRHPADISILRRTQNDYEEWTSVFYTTFINDTRFEILKRYDRLRMIGSGAQGVVW